MSTNAGQLLWNRQRITLAAGDTLVDTGIRQVNQNFAANSVGEPNLGIPGIAAPGDGTLPASRVQVIPMAPLSQWTNVDHSEPWVNTATGTVFVTFTGGGGETINVLFWDPHTAIGPGEAETYHPIA
jgi:hypothetical protein